MTSAEVETYINQGSEVKFDFLSMLPAWEIVIIALLACIGCLVGCIVLMGLGFCLWITFQCIRSALYPNTTEQVP